ncbi:MAG: hypothetical protein GFH27_549289n169 [Chloroflexi bacterium AL-W]|nr:hypothetical protein [Chloroflexi bacterium AL-N1]NOK66902.1 hypothetical protein [Chloroflexi bacterium AL-N10]NOK74806.1 hypothetical protein [Chloroflexi bacterium AL-N5]NOK81504.1 hypothetical protein [Chloroflexi bacterium AL-W]NOK88974.1 hypothetical protein [Chloroflexi bacterium AL-N15]
MQLTQAIRQMGRNDVKLVRRDSFLIGMFAYSIAIAVTLRFALPWFANFFAEQDILAFPLQEWYPMFIAYGVIFMGAVLAGMIFGFMLLDEKDDQTIKALLVMPMPLNYYMAYRVGVPAVVAFVMIVVEMLIVNLALPPLLPLLLIAAGAALTTPITALFFMTFAPNKVQGFALNKVIGVLGLIIIAAWFFEPPLQLIAGVFPPFWISKAYWMVFEGQSLWWGALTIGVVLQIVLIAVLLRLMKRVLYRL